MTREEAKDYLAIIYERSRKGKREYHDKYQDAFDLAIEALSADGDTISRKKTLERLTNISYNLCKTQAEDKIIEYAKTMVITMPSEQSEKVHERKKMIENDIALVICNPKNVENLISTGMIEDALVVTTLVPENFVSLIRKSDFLDLVNGGDVYVS